MGNGLEKLRAAIGRSRRNRTQARSVAPAVALTLLSCFTAVTHAQSKPPAQATPQPTAAAITQVDGGIRKEVVENLAQTLVDEYAIAETGAKLADFMRSQLTQGAYDKMTDPTEFARALHSDVRGAFDDRHLRVTFEPQAPTPLRGPPQGPGPKSAMPERDKLNGAIRRAQILPGNVGYMEVDAVPPFANAAIDAAFAFLRNTDALILDLRGNGGGAPETVAYYMSYLSEGEPYTVLRVRTRHRGASETRTTNLGERAYGVRRPVYVLTSYMTFSGGEELAYDIQAFKRGVVIGETTGGGANPGDPQPLGHGFVVFVPFGIVTHPATGKNWEAVGVQPDVSVPASLALLEAHRLAIERVQLSTTDVNARAALAQLIETLAQEKRSAAQSSSMLLANSLSELVGFYVPVAGEGPRYSIEQREGSLVLQPRSAKPPSKLAPVGDNKYQLEGLPDGATATFTASRTGTMRMLLQQPHWVTPMLFEKQGQASAPDGSKSKR